MENRRKRVLLNGRNSHDSAVPAAHERLEAAWSSARDAEMSGTLARHARESEFAEQLVDVLSLHAWRGRVAGEGVGDGREPESEDPLFLGCQAARGEPLVHRDVVVGVL